MSVINDGNLLIRSKYGSWKKNELQNWLNFFFFSLIILICPKIGTAQSVIINDRFMSKLVLHISSPVLGVFLLELIFKTVLEVAINYDLLIIRWRLFIVPRSVCNAILFTFLLPLSKIYAKSCNGYISYHEIE